jgi:acetyl-CoA carboxylase biotin carboxyl carrier protein
MSIDYDEIKRLIDLVEGNSLVELTVEQEDITVTVKAETGGERLSTLVPGSSQSAYVEQEVVSIAEPAVEEVLPEPSANIVEIKSPMVGVYYRYPSPDSPPFVEVGEQVEAGQTIGLIEAMKVFSEIPSEVAGRVVATPVGNGKLVQQGEVILVLDTTAE